MFIRFEAISEVLQSTDIKAAWAYTKGRCVVSNGRRFLKVDPQSGAVHEGCEVPNPKLDISSVHPVTGELILRCGDSDFSFWRIDIDTGMSSQIDTLHDMPNCRYLHFLPDGGKLLSASLSIGSQRQVCISHIGSSGTKVTTFKSTKIQSKKQKPWLSMHSGTAEMLYSGGTCIFAWPLNGDSEIMAGSTLISGTKDGVGRHARFQSLGGLRGDLGGSGHYIFCRDEEARLLRCLDLRTYQVCTVDVQGLDLFSSDFISSFHADGFLFVVMKRNAQSMQLFRGRLIASESSFLPDIKAVNLAENLRPVRFSFGGDEGSLYIDRRLLVARSDYFKAMFDSGCQEALTDEVDLRGEPSIKESEFRDVLRYVMSDAFLPSSDADEHIFKVRALADRYQFRGLKMLVEERLVAALSPENVLTFLSQAFCSGGALENACWGLLAEMGRDVLEDQSDFLTTLAVQNPEFTKALLLRGGDFGSTQKRRKIRST